MAAEPDGESGEDSFFSAHSSLSSVTDSDSRISEIDLEVVVLLPRPITTIWNFLDKDSRRSLLCCGGELREDITDSVVFELT